VKKLTKEDMMPECSECGITMAHWAGKWSCPNPECGHKPTDEEVEESQESQLFHYNESMLKKPAKKKKKK